MTDFRALCSDLLRELDHASAWDYQQALKDQARAALSEPEPEGPTDEEIGEWADACSEAPLEELDPEVHGWRRCFTAQEFGETIRAALARWGYEQRSAANKAELQQARDEELEAYIKLLDINGCPDRWIDMLRAARRPKPVSLKEQALAQTNVILNDPSRALLTEVRETLELNRRALEQLDDRPITRRSGRMGCVGENTLIP